jgi:hypothetical protein
MADAPVYHNELKKVNFARCCESEMFIADPDFLSFQDLGYEISDRTTATKEVK